MQSILFDGNRGSPSTSDPSMEALEYLKSAIAAQQKKLAWWRTALGFAWERPCMILWPPQLLWWTRSLLFSQAVSQRMTCSNTVKVQRNMHMWVEQIRGDLRAKGILSFSCAVLIFQMLFGPSGKGGQVRKGRSLESEGRFPRVLETDQALQSKKSSENFLKSGRPPVRFGSVTVWGCNGSRGSGFGSGGSSAKKGPLCFSTV